MTKTTITFDPYIGGAGPTKEQQENNNRYMLKILKAAGYSDAKMGPDTVAVDMEGGKASDHAKIVHFTIGRKLYYLAYDRWGFMLMEPNSLPGKHHPILNKLDQASPGQIMDALQIISNPKA